MHGGDLIVDVLVRHGVRTLFTLVGGHISPLLVAAKARGIRVVDVRDEATAAFAADATSRLCGAPGVAAVTAGPGVTNTITALKNAQLAQSPLVLLGGATATVLKGRGLAAGHRPDGAGAAAREVGGCRHARPRPRAQRSSARSRRPAPACRGPAFVECPVDLLYPEATVREWYFAGQRPPKSLSERAVRWYLQCHLDAGVRRASRAASPPGAPGGHARTRPTPTCARRARICGRAERPVLVVSSQAVGVGADVAALAAASTPRVAGVPVRHGARPARARATRSSSGTSARRPCARPTSSSSRARPTTSGSTTGGRSRAARRSSPSTATATTSMKNRRPTLGACTRRPTSSCRRSRNGTRPRARVRGSRRCATANARATRDILAQAEAPVNGVNPIALVPRDRRRAAGRQRHRRGRRRLRRDRVLRASPAATAVVAGPGRVRHPRRRRGVHPRRALRAAAAQRSGRSTATAPWASASRSSTRSSVTAFRSIAVVGNDAKWAQIARDQVAVLGDDVATRLARTDYHKVVEGFGARGLLLDDPGGRRGARWPRRAGSRRRACPCWSTPSSATRSSGRGRCRSEASPTAGPARRAPSAR